MSEESDTVSDVSSPNVMAFSWVVPSGEVVWTLYRSTPGITEPRLAFENLTDGAKGDCGPVVVPSRFGSVGTTKAEFKAWVLRFIRSTGQEA